jgi:hypothetical protein
MSACGWGRVFEPFSLDLLVATIENAVNLLFRCCPCEILSFSQMLTKRLVTSFQDKNLWHMYGMHPCISAPFASSNHESRTLLY